MKAIFKRELGAYFTSALGYVYIAAFALFTGLAFYITNIQGSFSSMKSFFAVLSYLSPLFLPLLTVRIFAEDKKLKTDQLLLTAPVSTMGVIFGKFLAAAAMFAIGFAVVVLYPVILSRYGNVSVPATVCAYLGYILFAVLILSVGAFMSALTDNQITAAALTYAVIILFMAVRWVTGFIPNEAVVNGLRWLSPIDRVLSEEGFLYGRISIADIVYFLSISGLFLFFTAQTFEKRRLG